MKKEKNYYWQGASLFLMTALLGILLFHSIRVAYPFAVTRGLILAAVVIFVFFLRCVFYIFRQRREHTAALKRAAYFDELCQCPNLPKFKLDAQRFISKNPNDSVLMVKLDISGFRLLNKMLGEKSGDLILTRIADSLRKVVLSGCFCRAHSDEFYVLLACDSAQALDEIQEKFLAQVYALLAEDIKYPVRFAAGHYFMSFENCQNAAEAVEKVNMAHRRAKELGLDVCVYDEALSRRALQRTKIECQMTQALANGEFKVYLQAQYTLSDEAVCSAEALVRWEDPEGNLISPCDFIPIFEENGFILSLDFYIFKRICETLREWLDDGIAPIEISVNFSRKHLANPNFVQELCDISDQYHVPHRLLTVELTESAIGENEKILLKMAGQLRQKGFRLAMDDFGTGYASLSVLKNLPVDILKIDRSFFTDNHDEIRARLLISSVMRMAEALGMITVAEGVEDKEQIDFLRDVGCDKVQSFYYEHPVPIEKWYEQRKNV